MVGVNTQRPAGRKLGSVEGKLAKITGGRGGAAPGSPKPSVQLTGCRQAPWTPRAPLGEQVSTTPTEFIPKS